MQRARATEPVQSSGDRAVGKCGREAACRCDSGALQRLRTNAVTPRITLSTVRTAHCDRNVQPPVTPSEPSNRASTYAANGLASSDAMSQSTGSCRNTVVPSFTYLASICGYKSRYKRGQKHR